MVDPWVRAVIATVADHRIPGHRAPRGADGSLVPGGPAHFATLLNTVIAEAARCLRSPPSAARASWLSPSAVSSRTLCERAFTLNCGSEQTGRRD